MKMHQLVNVQMNTAINKRICPGSDCSVTLRPILVDSPYH